jgi:nitroreductase
MQRGTVVGLAPETLRAVQAAAARAASLDGGRSWRLHEVDGAVELHADPAPDPAGRERRIGCGAAVFAVRLALVGQGVRPLVSLLPDRARPELVAVVRAGGRVRPTPRQRELLAALDRRPARGGRLEAGARHDLARAALEEGAWLELVDDERRAVLSDLARTDTPPLVAVLSVHAEGPREDLRAGEALQHVLLAAAVRGLSVSFLSELVDVPEVRERVRRLLATGTGSTRPPQAVLRLHP